MGLLGALGSGVKDSLKKLNPLSGSKAPEGLRHVLIVGGTSGLGLKILEAFLKSPSGFTTYILTRKETAEVSNDVRGLNNR
jgi:hypothetical protein